MVWPYKSELRALAMRSPVAYRASKFAYMIVSSATERRPDSKLQPANAASQSLELSDCLASFANMIHRNSRGSDPCESM